MIKFSRVIFERVLEEIPVVHRRVGRAVPVSINVSPLFFLHPGFSDYVLRTIRTAKADPRLITLEITEDSFIDEVGRIAQIIRPLREAGVGVALDDFGKGYSSLYYISHMDLTELKVDKSFIAEISTNEQVYGLFNAICTIAETFGYQVVAEGVENEQQILRLRETTCRIAQGYYYSRPGPAEPQASVGA
jgi:EAL domain-containing protein (putative c-di-GMP-specific phosphodiesterase class I)